MSSVVVRHVYVPIYHMQLTSSPVIAFIRRLARRKNVTDLDCNNYALPLSDHHPVVFHGVALIEYQGRGPLHCSLMVNNPGVFASSTPASSQSR